MYNDVYNNHKTNKLHFFIRVLGINLPISASKSVYNNKY